MAGIGSVTFVEDKSEITERCTAIVTNIAEVMIPMGDLIDFEKERERITKEIAQAEAEIKKAKGLLSNQGFVAKAPQKLIDNEKEKLLRASSHDINSYTTRLAAIMTGKIKTCIPSCRASANQPMPELPQSTPALV